MVSPAPDKAGRSAACAGEDELHRFVQGDLGAKRGREIDAHIAECSSCRELLDAIEAETIDDVGPPEIPKVSVSVSVGEEIDGRFRIERELGRGGMGVVYAARHLAMARACAVKVLTDRIIADEESVLRFIRETRLLAKLESPHVVRVFDVGRLPSGAPYMVMELLEGEDLERMRRREGRIPIARAVELIIEACEGVGEAHASGVVHRDLKLENLFLARAVPRPIVKVLDFGIAKGGREIGEGSLTRAEAIMGTPRYMPPEQIVSARNVDARSDVWALGVCLYRLLTGKYPFDGPHVAALWARISAATPVRPSTRCQDVPPALDAVVLRCLAREPASRYAGTAELAAALREALLDLPTLSDEAPPIATPRVPIARTVGRPSPPPPTPTPSPPPSLPSVTMPVVRPPALSIPSSAPPPPPFRETRPSFPEALPPPPASRASRVTWPLVATIAVAALAGLAAIASATREKKVVEVAQAAVDAAPAAPESATPSMSAAAASPASPAIVMTSVSAPEPRRIAPGIHRPRPSPNSKPAPAPSSSERHYERM